MDRRSADQEQSALDGLLPLMPHAVRARVFSSVHVDDLPRPGEPGWDRRPIRGFTLAVWHDVVWVPHGLLLREEELECFNRDELRMRLERYGRYRCGAERCSQGHEEIDRIVARLRSTGTLSRPPICISALGRLRVLDGIEEFAAFEWHYSGLPGDLRPAMDVWIGKHVEGSARR